MDQKRKLGTILGVALGLLLAGGGLLAWLLGWFSPAPAARPFERPGSAAGSVIDGLTVDVDWRTSLRSRLFERLGTADGFREWYQQQDRDTGLAAVTADRLLASDQLQYGAWLIEQDLHSDFTTWQAAFQGRFLATDGLVIKERTVTADGSLNPADLVASGSWPPTLQYLRILGQAYARWPSRTLDEAERRLSDRLLDLWQAGLTADREAAIPTTAPTLDPAATPTPKPTGDLKPTPMPGQSAAVIELASLDLLTMRSLAGLDPAWEKLYETALGLTAGGYLGDDLPLYATGWLPASEGYLMFDGDQPVVDTEATIAVVLHLAEVGQAQTRSINWIKERLFNDRALYERYHLAQGQPTSTVECLPAYAMTARIARIVGDKTLYAKAVERLAWHRATSGTSSVLGAVFRQDEAGLIRMTAHDNLWSLLAFE